MTIFFPGKHYLLLQPQLVDIGNDILNRIAKSIHLKAIHFSPGQVNGKNNQIHFFVKQPHENGEEMVGHSEIMVDTD